MSYVDGYVLPVPKKSLRAYRRMAEDHPDVILHLAAATDVDACEQNPEWAHAVNALGTMNVAKVAVLGTGVNPGFVMDLLPVVISSMLS